ncbi:cytochrome ubiquinol oxidase subunit I, partial [Enterococcus faecalis]
VGAGVVMILAALGGLWLNRRKKLENSKWYLRIMIALISFPFLANSAGWIMTEIGRQPWTVMGLMTTAQSVSPNVTAGSLLFSIIA